MLWLDPFCAHVPKQRMRIGYLSESRGKMVAPLICTAGYFIPRKGALCTGWIVNLSPVKLKTSKVLSFLRRILHECYYLLHLKFVQSVSKIKTCNVFAVSMGTYLSEILLVFFTRTGSKERCFFFVILYCSLRPSWCCCPFCASNNNNNNNKNIGVSCK